MAAARRDWSALGKRSRDRYLSAGRSGKLTGTPGLTEAQVRRYYESGQSLASAFGKSKYVQGPPRGAAPREATDRAAQYLDTPDDLVALERWRDRSSPAWLPRNRSAMGTDTAAILSQIPGPPEKWKHLEFNKLANGQYLLTVTRTDRGPVTIVTLPDTDSMHEVTSFLRNPAAMAGSDKERTRLERQWRRAAPTVNVTGTDQAANGRPLPLDEVPPINHPAGTRTTARRPAPARSPKPKKTAPKKTTKKARKKK